MSVVLEIMSDSQDEIKSEMTEPTLDYPDESRLLTPTSDFDYSPSGDDDYESRAEKMQELEDYVNVTAAVMAKRSRQKLKRSSDKTSRKAVETDESERYLKKIKTLQQNKRRQETRIKKLAGDVKVLKDKISIQASYIDVLCGMLTPELRERFRGRQGLGILGNVLPETNAPEEVSAQAEPADIVEESEPSILCEKEDDSLVDMDEEDGKFHCVEDLTEQQSDGRSITVDGEQERISEDFSEGAVEKTQNVKKEVQAPNLSCQIADQKSADDKNTEGCLENLTGTTESKDCTATTKQAADVPELITDGTSSLISPDVETISPSGSTIRPLIEETTSQQDGSCASPIQTDQTPIPQEQNEVARKDEDDDSEAKALKQTEFLQENCVADPSSNVRDKAVCEDTKSQETPLSEEASHTKESMPSPELPANSNSPCSNDASKYPSEENEKKHESIDSVLSDYPAIASATIDDFLAEYAPRVEDSPSKYNMNVSIPGPSNVTVPVVSIPPVSLSVPIVSIPSSSLSVPIVTVPPSTPITKPLPRLTMRGRRNPRRRCTFRTRPNIPALRNEHLIQQDYSIAGINPLQFCSKYDFTTHQGDVSQQYRHPANSSVADFIQTGNLPVQRLPLGNSFDGIMAGYQGTQSLCIPGLDGSISQGNVAATDSERNLSDLF